MFINASCVIGLGLEVKAFREAMCGCSSLGCGVRVDMIGRDCELEISEILLMGDPGIRVSQYGIIAFMCTITSRRVGCGCTVWSFTKIHIQIYNTITKGLLSNPRQRRQKLVK